MPNRLRFHGVFLWAPSTQLLERRHLISVALHRLGEVLADNCLLSAVSFPHIYRKQVLKQQVIMQSQL